MVHRDAALERLASLRCTAKPKAAAKPCAAHRRALLSKRHANIGVVYEVLHGLLVGTQTPHMHSAKKQQCDICNGDGPACGGASALPPEAAAAAGAPRQFQPLGSLPGTHLEASAALAVPQEVDVKQLSSSERSQLVESALATEEVDNGPLLTRLRKRLATLAYAAAAAPPDPHSSLPDQP